MRALSENNLTAKGNILPFSRFRLFSDIENTQWSEAVKAQLIKNAEAVKGAEYPMLTATDFLRFQRDGNRKFYENKYFWRRDALLTFLAAEFAEGKGRFTDEIINLTWLILEETTWVLPAHARGNGLPYEYEAQVGCVDLFAATTAATLAFVFYYGAQTMGENAVVIRERILYELYRRILIPYQKYEMISWMGFDRKKINNWNPWIVSNILTVVALCVEDLPQREAMTERLMVILDNFINGYESDGGCDEGPAYWTAAGASLFDALELLYDLSGGKIDIFGVPLIRRMGEYIMNVHINDNYYVNFADSCAKIAIEYDMVARFGRRTRSKALESFGKNGMRNNPPECKIANFHTYRSFKRLADRTVGPAEEYYPPKSIFMDGVCIMIQRECGAGGKALYLAAKGGNNGESHNHNDLGSFVVYAGGEPLIIDVGVETYSRDTFDLKKRYAIWTMQSAYHNIPEFNGVMQAAGIDYAAQDVVYDKDQRALSMQLKNAYPEEAGIESYIRRVAMEKGRIVLTDDVALRSKGTAEFTFMLAGEPRLTQRGVIELSGGHRLSYHKGLEASCEKIALKDEKLRLDWQREAVYRVRLKGDNILSGIFKTIIE